MGCEAKIFPFTPIPNTEEYERCRHIVNDMDYEELYPYAFPLACDEMPVEFLSELFSFKLFKSIVQLEGDGPVLNDARKRISKDSISITIPEMKNISKRNYLVANITFREEELNEKTSNKMLESIHSAEENCINILFSKPIPPCIFSRKGYAEFTKKYKYNLPRDCHSCLHKNECNFSEDNMPKKCKACLFFKRSKCKPCFVRN